MYWQPERRQWDSRRRGRVRNSRAGRTGLIWDAVSRVLGLKLKPEVCEPVIRTESGWLAAEYESP